MRAPSDLDRRIPERAGQTMEAVKRSFVQLEDGPGPQFERPLSVPHMGGDYFDREVELSEAILRLTTRNLVRIAE
jgi:hypothetical protein